MHTARSCSCCCCCLTVELFFFVCVCVCILVVHIVWGVCGFFFLLLGRLSVLVRRVFRLFFGHAGVAVVRIAFAGLHAPM